MRCELLVAPLFIVTFHFINRFADGRTCSAEHPGACGAAPAVKILSFNPYHSAAHRLHRTSPNWCGYVSVKACVALVFRCTAATKAPFQCPEAKFCPSHRALKTHQDGSKNRG